jgi:hypothetical protein
MSNLNDNNLDDLLRRAAEKYPLRTDSANFDKLVADLEKDTSLILPPVAEDRRRRRRFLWLFFLLPLAGGAYYAWHATGQAHHAGVAKEKQAPAAPGTTTTAAAAKGEGKPQEKDNTAIENTTKEKRTEDNSTKSEIAKDNSTKSNIIKDNTTRQHTIKNNTTKNITPAGEKANGGNGNEEVATAAHIGAGQRKQAVPANGKITGYGNKARPGREESGDSGNERLTDQGKNATGAGNEVVKTPARTPSDHKVSLAPTKSAVAVNIPVKANAEGPVKKNPAAKDKIKLQKPKPSFYVGIMGSPDLSLIRFQSIKAVGSNFGLLLGYSFNSRWAVETGIYYDRKKYYTEGEYFSKSKVPRLNYIDLKTVDGICNMWEIPLNVRYNFSSRNNKTKWFATGGLSTYLMSKETYTFTGEYGGNPNWTQTWPYNKPYQYWFSILNLSVGYEQRLGKIGNLRLEPFLRVPLAGIGTGSLSIMSAGLNIGITRRIW